MTAGAKSRRIFSTAAMLYFTKACFSQFADWLPPTLKVTTFILTQPCGDAKASFVGMCVPTELEAAAICAKELQRQGELCLGPQQ